MKVLQLIDSLRPGGAEKMAVNIANALVPCLEGSYLCCTREEGLLKKNLKPEVNYIFLNKRFSLDPKALLKLRYFLKKNKIDIVHAHSTSYFLAGLLKLSGGNFKLIWHDHYGESEFIEKRKFQILKIFSRLFSGIISVNTILKTWAFQELNCENIIELKNFIPRFKSPHSSVLKLKGVSTHFKIICVANLRPQKDHFNLIKAFEIIGKQFPVSLHLVGANFEDSYSESVLDAVKKSPSSDRIFYYGAQSKITELLAQASLGILASRSEGLPLALLEYGMVGLPVIVTEVGHCREIVGEFGLTVPPNNSDALAKAITHYFHNTEMRKIDASCFKKKIIENYSERSVLSSLLKYYKNF